MTVLESGRVVLRPWRPSDRAGFRRMGANPRVMEFLPGLLGPAESDALADRIAAALERRGWGWWALEVPGVAEFGGFVGLGEPACEMPFGKAVEIAWRLDEPLWGHGYATEAAGLAMDHGFTALGLAEIVSFTATVNQRSQAVMRRLGMKADGEFDHPALAEGHWLRRHVLYRKTAP